MKTDTSASVIKHQSQRYSVLLVDDEPEVTYVLKKGLEAIGQFDVSAFTDPETALRSMANKDYHILVIDIKMPKMSGFDFCEQALKIDGSPVIVFLTASESYREEYERRFPKLNGNCFIIKPISIKALTSFLLSEVS